MMQNHFSKSGVISILGIIILAVLVVLILNYFHISVRVIVGPEGGEKSSVTAGRSLWNEYVREPLLKLWSLIKELFWQPFVSNLNNLREGKPTDFQNSTPAVPY